jgi:hypothetical protein
MANLLSSRLDPQIDPRRQAAGSLPIPTPSMQDEAHRTCTDTDAQVLEDAERLICRLERPPGQANADAIFADDRRRHHKRVIGSCGYAARPQNIGDDKPLGSGIG